MGMELGWGGWWSLVSRKKMEERQVGENAQVGRTSGIETSK
jgi:hypothetical protein